MLGVRSQPLFQLHATQAHATYPLAMNEAIALRSCPEGDRFGVFVQWGFIANMASLVSLWTRLGKIKTLSGRAPLAP